MAGILKALVKEETQPARSVLFELLVLLMGNGWRRGNHIIRPNTDAGTATEVSR